MSVETNKAPIKILIVDDQASMRITLAGIFRRQGYAVTLAEDGYQALEAVSKNEFRAILMDIKMPGMSGVETFLKIKKIRPNVSVIMMTAFALEDDIRQAIREGAYAIVHKPFEMDQIMAKLDECLDQRKLVMVVDDRVADREGMQKILQSKGYNTVIAQSGEECIKQLVDRKFQVVLLDVKMSGMDGFDTLRAIREIRPETAVILISGQMIDARTLMEEDLESVVSLRKPVDVDELLKVVGRYADDDRG